MVDLSSINPLSNVQISSIGLVLLVFFVAVLILGIITFGVVMWIKRKKLKFKIPLYKKIGSAPMKVAEYKAKEVPISKAGDILWYVPKKKKYLSPATIQIAPNEYTHFEREDGEWINFRLGDIDESMKKAGVKYVQQDMRSNRIAIGDILENRFKDRKSWWEKYGHLVTHLIFYIVVLIAMVVIFYQWSTIIDKTNMLLDKIIKIEEKQKLKNTGVVPALIPLLLSWRYRLKK